MWLCIFDLDGDMTDEELHTPIKSGKYKGYCPYELVWAKRDVRRYQMNPTQRVMRILTRLSRDRILYGKDLELLILDLAYECGSAAQWITAKAVHDRLGMLWKNGILRGTAIFELEEFEGIKNTGRRMFLDRVKRLSKKQLEKGGVEMEYLFFLTKQGAYKWTR